jgi:hypothetical protein
MGQRQQVRADGGWINRGRHSVTAPIGAVAKE